MSVKNQIYESVWSDRWCLAGSVTTSAQLMPASHSLTLIRSFDALSPVIMSAMNAGSIIPVVEINTPSGKVTLENATIVNIAPPGPRAGRKHGKPRDTHELTEIEITFTKIWVETGKKGNGWVDDWSSGS